MTKSHVSLGQHQCPVCGKMHDSGEVLLDRFLRDKLDEKTVTGHSMCPEHQKMKDDGYIALVEMEQNATQLRFTGRIAHVRTEAWPKIFNAPAPEQGVARVDKTTMDMLMRTAGPDDEIH